MIDKEKERRVSFQKRQQAFGPAAKYCLFSYSEWWRYIGPVKPRQPLGADKTQGRCPPERETLRADRTIRNRTPGEPDAKYSEPLKSRTA